MNTSTSSIFIALFVWYIALGLFNLAYFGLTRKMQALDWKKFILETIGILLVYVVVNVASIQMMGGSNVGLFAITNGIFLLGAVYAYSKYAMRFEVKDSLIYSGTFTAVFNLYWYVLFGII